MKRLWSFLLFLCYYSIKLNFVSGHARLLNPPSRASKWRLGFSMPAADYDDNQGYCGGRSRQWHEFKGKCGVCGDPFRPIPRAHERGGRYYTGEITKSYKQGDIIEADVEVTANHRGWFEFKICPYDSPRPEDVERDQNGRLIEVTQRCLDKHPIPLADGSGYKFDLPSPFKRGIQTVKLRLPFNLVCNQCLFQWKYNTGNSWGTTHNGSACLGCGHQEQFFSCADVKITASAGRRPRPPMTRTTRRPGMTRPWRGNTRPWQPSTGQPPFWSRIPGRRGWWQNPDFVTSPLSPTTTTTTPRFWPWWFFDKDNGWFNRDVWATSTVAPTESTPPFVWRDWQGTTTWDRWFLDEEQTQAPRHIPLASGDKQSKPPRKKSSKFWERWFFSGRQNFWTWFLKDIIPDRKRTARKRQRIRTRTTTTRRPSTTTTPRETTTSPWWRWWYKEQPTTTQAPKWRSWWDTWPWGKKWDTSPQDDDDDEKETQTPRPRNRWRPKTRTTHTSRPWETTSSPTKDMKEQHSHNNHEDNDSKNTKELTDGERSPETSQTSSNCHPVGIWTSLPGMTGWCVINCASGFCPEGYCSSGCRS